MHVFVGGMPANDEVSRRVTILAVYSNAADMVRMGKDLEKIVLAKALWWHANHKVLVYGNKTVVFE